MSSSIASDEVRLAIERGDVQVVDRALQGGLSSNAVISYDNGWKTRPLLNVAVECGQKDVAARLIDGGADVNKADSEYADAGTPLLAAAEVR